MEDSAQIARALDAAAGEVKEYAGSPGYKQIATMLELLASLYALDLMEVTADNLPAKQAAIKQVVAIRDVVVGREHAQPQI